MKNQRKGGKKENLSRATAHKVVKRCSTMVAKWRRHGAGEISAVGPGRKGIQQYLDSGHNGANEPWPWFRRFSSREITRVCTSTPREPASLCHYYRGTFLTVSIAVDKKTFSTLPPLSSQSQLEQLGSPPMIP